MEKNSKMKIIAQKLGPYNQLMRSVTKLKNGIYDGSYTAKILTLEDITDPKNFAEFAKIKEWWMKGSYLNKSPFNSTNTLYPDTQYAKQESQNFVNFVTKAIQSSNSIIAIQDIMANPEFGNKNNKVDFNNILRSEEHTSELQSQ